MKTKIRQQRITIRVIFLLVVQTVCLAGIPVQRAVMQLIPDVVVSEAEEPAGVRVGHSERADIRRQAQRMILLAAAAVTVLMFTVCVQRLPARTLTACKVRLND